MLKLLSKLPRYWLARNGIVPVPLPVSFTLGLTYRCNARCRTCRIYEHKPVKELNPGEWREIFKSLMQSPFWVTFSGGEPFLYEDLVEVYWDLCEICKPRQVNIPTNGLLTDRIVDWVWEMAKLRPEVQLVINISLDHHNPIKNDDIRGVRGYFEKATKTLKELQELDADNLTVGLHTVISRFNIVDFKWIVKELPKLLKNKSHYVTEIAEERVELETVGLPITPVYEKYKEAVGLLKDRMEERNIINSFRQQYYDSVVNWLNSKKGLLACYAGYASCQIAPDGDVWFCCYKAKSIGNLRSIGYDFKKLWNNEEAQEMRLELEDCHCPMANVSYTNMLMNPMSLAKVVKGLVI